MYYTYILQSIKSKRIYIGHTANLKNRLVDHNIGKCKHTSKYKPWMLKLYLAFENLKTAQKFERYLKSGSGHAFMQRHFDF
jgi:putative endonuclease